jgi:hypothetical protein
MQGFLFVDTGGQNVQSAEPALQRDGTEIEELLLSLSQKVVVAE